MRTTSGSSFRDRGERRLAVGGLADDLDVLLELQERPQSLAHDSMVVDDEDGDHGVTVRRTVVPASGCETTCTRRRCPSRARASR